MHDDFAEVDKVYFENMDGSDLEIIEKLVVDNDMFESEAEEALHTNEDLALHVNNVVYLGLRFVDVTNLHVSHDKKMNFLVEVFSDDADMIFIWEDFIVVSCEVFLHGYTIGILVFEGMKQRYWIYGSILLFLMHWKPLVKMKLWMDYSFGIKVCYTLFYLSEESDASESWMLPGVLTFMVH